MSLWNPKRPLNQPPSFGRVTAQDNPSRNYAQACAEVAHKGAQFDRLDQTKKYGLRAKVR
jgi:hypothetical protein